MKILRDYQLTVFSLSVVLSSLPILLANSTDNRKVQIEIRQKFLDGLHLKISAAQVS
jgi:hypothetical protein